ncbi:hypothetical protein [Maribellus maritimus]|uniref:hypothetical protein n=1 Tax=Maribellus maritimus TaxID=2870838 RepID=UPI00374D8DC4
MNKNLFEGVITLKGEGYINQKKTNFKAIPYYTWENRGVSEICLPVIENETKLNKHKESP